MTGPKSYYNEVFENFDYGVANWISPSHILENISHHIPQDRNVVLVFHGRVQRTLKDLADIGFDFGNYPNILGYLDTRDIAEESGIRNERLSCLRQCWGYTKAQREIAIAGNEANFTLRVLILRSLEAYEEQWCPGIVGLWPIGIPGVPLWRRVALKVMALNRNLYTGPRIPCTRENEMGFPCVTDKENDEGEHVDDEWELVGSEEWDLQSESKVVHTMEVGPSQNGEDEDIPSGF